MTMAVRLVADGPKCAEYLVGVGEQILRGEKMGESKSVGMGRAFCDAGDA